MAVVVSPRVDVLLKEELARFRSELQTVRASFESVPDGRGERVGDPPEDMLLKQHSFLSDSDLSSDGSDWEECYLRHEEDEQEEQSVLAYADAGELHHIVDGGRLRWQSGKVADQSAKMHPEVYAPKDPPTRQRPKQFVVPESSTHSYATPNPNPNGQVLTEETYSRSSAEVAKELAQEVLRERTADQDEGFEENNNGPAREMALRIQQLLEVSEVLSRLTWLSGVVDTKRLGDVLLAHIVIKGMPEDCFQFLLLRKVLFPAEKLPSFVAIILPW